MTATVPNRGMSGHQLPYRGKTNDWLTPPEIIRALGPFDLDPCCPENMPWRTAHRMLTRENDGLSARWNGRVWLNPPYGPDTAHWLEKMGNHGHGTALIFARTETRMFFRWVWNHASALKFLEGRLHFHYTDGERAKFNSGAPSVLVAYGETDAEILRESKSIGGWFVKLGARKGGNDE